VRSDIVRIYKTVHTWTGILSGMALFIAFYAGAITLFKESLVHWATPPAVVARAAAELSDAGLITRTLASHPGAAREFEVRLRRVDASPTRLEWTIHQEGSDEHDVLSVRHMVATLGPDGTVRAEEVARSHLAEFIDVLHRVVGMPVDGDWTRSCMGVVAALYFLALFSGLVTLLPSLVKDLFALRVGPNLKRMWLDGHNVVGLGSFPFHVVMALTAAVFAFHDPIYAVQNSLVHEGKLGAMFGRGAPGASTPRDIASMLPPSELVARVTALAPDFEPTLLRYTRVTGPGAAVFVFGHDTRALEQRALGGLAIVDPYSGRVTTTAYLPGHQNASETILSSLFALHFASYGGKPVKWMYFVLALLGAWLVYSGNLLWIESRRKRQKSRDAAAPLPVQGRGTYLMASTTVGVCLGAVCGISLTIGAAKWLHGQVGDLNDWHRMLYYATFFASIGWSFYRGGARASVDLLRGASVLTLALPLTSLVAALVPSLGLWAHPTLDSLAVDLTALAVGLLFASAARRTARRVYHGHGDSVWSAGHTVGSPHAPAVAE
jgi:uncharacterized iron-regulated membrane protein